MKVNNFVIISLASIIVYSSNSHIQSKNIEDLIVPHKIVSFMPTAFKCFGRTWFISNDLNPKLIQDKLILQYNGIHDTSHIFTAPEENNEKKIVTHNKSNIVIEFSKKLINKVYFSYVIIANDFTITEGKVDGFNKSKIVIPLNRVNESINNLKISFSGENSKIEIKRVYLY